MAIRYRREIDGLRAVAVIPVILYHAGFETFQGGYVGVDVFFVISGFLITSLILAEQETGTFTFLNFYERRARRILPALFVVMAACLPFAWLWLLPGDMTAFLNSVIAVPLFGSNFLFASESGYFDRAAELKPLLHTWSLGVEEQYYLAFPILLYAATRLGKRGRLAILVLLWTVSFATAQWSVRNDPANAFYLLPARGWELLLGSFAALGYAGSHLRAINPLVREGAVGLGMVLIVGAVFGFSASTPMPGLLALLPTLGTVLIVLLATPETGVGRLLSTKAFVGIGLISYSAYLWHQPILAFARHRLLAEPAKPLLLLLSSLALILAYFSWRFVEQPFRRRGAVTRTGVFTFALLGSACIVSAGLLGHRWNDTQAVTLSWLGGHPLPQDFGGVKRDGESCSGREPARACWISDGQSTRTIVIVGDSHARVLTQPAAQSVGTYGFTLIDLSSSGCAFLLGLDVFVNGVKQNDCDVAVQDRRLEFLRSLPPSIVMLHARYPLYIHGQGFDNTVGGVEKRLPYIAATHPDADLDTRYTEIRESLLKTVNAVERLGHTVVIVGAVPPAGWDPVRRLYRIEKLGIGRSHEERSALMAVPAAAVAEYNELAARMLRESESAGRRVLVVDPVPLFCSKTDCSSITEGSILYSDSNHLSLDGSTRLFTAVMERLEIPPLARRNEHRSSAIITRPRRPIVSRAR